MAEKKFSELTSASQVNETDIVAMSQEGSGGTWASVKATILALATKIATGINFTSALQTTDKTITGAINESLKYDSSTTVNSKIDAIDLTEGGTIKNSSGNTFLLIDGATSSNYGQLQLKRGDYSARLTPANNLSADRDFTFPNASGNLIVSRDYGVTYTATGSGSSLSNYETWKSLFNRVRTGSFSGAIRRSQIMCSVFDGQANIIFSCQKYQSGNYSVWGSFRGSGTAMVWYIVNFSSSNAVAVYKHVLTSTGLTITTLTDEPAASESSGEITPVTITII